MPTDDGRLALPDVPDVPDLPDLPDVRDDVLRPDPLGNRYAVPLGTLVAGAFVAHADQVVIHPQPAADVHFGDGAAGAGDDPD